MTCEQCPRCSGETVQWILREAIVSVFSQKAVTYAPFGDDVTRLSRGRFYLPAQTMNVDAQGVFEHLFERP